MFGAVENDLIILIEVIETSAGDNEELARFICRQLIDRFGRLSRQRSAATPTRSLETCTPSLVFDLNVVIDKT